MTKSVVGVKVASSQPLRVSNDVGSIRCVGRYPGTSDWQTPQQIIALSILAQQNSLKDMTILAYQRLDGISGPLSVGFDDNFVDEHSTENSVNSFFSSLLCKEHRTSSEFLSQNTRVDLLQLMIDAQGSELEHSSLTIGEKDDDAKPVTSGCPIAGGPRSYKLTDEEVVDNAFQVLLAG